MRCPGSELPAKPGNCRPPWRPCVRGAVGEADGGVAARSYCSDLVQKLCPHLAFPLRGRCRRKPTDEVIFRGALRHLRIHIFQQPGSELPTKPVLHRIAALLRTMYGRALLARFLWFCQRPPVELPQNTLHYREAAAFRFCRHSRHRADAITASVAAFVRL